MGMAGQEGPRGTQKRDFEQCWALAWPTAYNTILSSFWYESGSFWNVLGRFWGSFGDDLGSFCNFLGQFLE